MRILDKIHSKSEFLDGIFGVCNFYWLTRFSVLTSGCLIRPLVLTTLVLVNCPRGNSFLFPFSRQQWQSTGTGSADNSNNGQTDKMDNRHTHNMEQTPRDGSEPNKIWGGHEWTMTTSLARQQGRDKPAGVTAPPKIGDRRETGAWEAFRQMSDRNITRPTVTTTRAVETRVEVVRAARPTVRSGSVNSQCSNMSNNRPVILFCFMMMNMNTHCLFLYFSL